MNKKTLEWVGNIQGQLEDPVDPKSCISRVIFPSQHDERIPLEGCRQVMVQFEAKSKKGVVMIQVDQDQMFWDSKSHRMKTHFMITSKRSLTLMFSKLEIMYLSDVQLCLDIIFFFSFLFLQQSTHHRLKGGTTTELQTSLSLFRVVVEALLYALYSRH